MRVLFVYPPHTRNTEPPLGAALLGAFLKEAGVEAFVVDLNAICGPYLAARAPSSGSGSRRRRRALRRVRRSIEALRGRPLYGSASRYRLALEDYAEALRASGEASPFRITPGDLRYRGAEGFGPRFVRLVASGIVQGFWNPFFEAVLRQRIAAFDPELVGISITYRSQFVPGLCCAAWLRAEEKKRTVVLGGAFFQSVSEETARACEKLLAPTFAGAGEEPLRNLLGLPSSCRARSFRDPLLSGIDFGLYFSPIPVLPIPASRGCYWGRCTFCAESGAPFCMDRPEDFCARLSRLAARYRPCLFHFTDNAIPLPILRALASQGSPAPWYGFVRPEPELADPDFVEALAASGCVMLQLGLETPVAEQLLQMGKGVDPELFLPILANLRKAGIASYVYLLFGFPTQGLADCEQSLAFVEAAQPDFLNAALFRAPLHSEGARRSRDSGNRKAQEPDPESLYRQVGKRKLEVRELRRWFSARFKRSQAVRHALSATPRYYKSSHAVFFTGDLPGSTLDT